MLSVVGLLVSFEFVCLVHSYVLIYQLIDLFVHIVGKLSPDHPPVTKDDEEQKHQESNHTYQHPDDDVLWFGLEHFIYTLARSIQETVTDHLFNFVCLKVTSIS